MGIVSIMAAILEERLREHGILKLTRRDCETMVHSMIERAAEFAPDIEPHRLGPQPGGSA
jgi:hypothetical protein